MAKRVMQLIIACVLVQLFVLGGIKTYSTITGTQPPSLGNDWVINEPTVVKNENITMDGSIIVNNTLTIRDSTIWFKTAHQLSITEHGSIKMDNVTIKGFDLNVRWNFVINNSGQCSINNSKLIGMGSPGQEEQYGLWIGSSNVSIDNVSFIGVHYALMIRSAANITISNSYIIANYTTNSVGIRIIDSDSINIKDTTIVDAGLTGIKVENSKNIDIQHVNVHIDVGSGALYLSDSKDVNIMNSDISNSNGFGIYTDNVSNILFLFNNVTSHNHAFFINNGGRGFYIENTNITTDAIAIYTRGSELNSLFVIDNIIKASINGYDFKNVTGSYVGSNRLISLPGRYCSLNSVYNTTFAAEQINNANRGIYITDSALMWFSGVYLNTSGLSMEVHKSTSIFVEKSTFNTTANGFTIYDSNTINITNTTINSIENALYAKNATMLHISGNVIHSVEQWDLSLSDITNTTVDDNHLFGSRGLLLAGNSHNVSVTQNEILTTMSNELYNSTGLTFSSNTIVTNSTALILNNVSISTMTKNVITALNSNGMIMSYNSSYNVIDHNTFIDCASTAIYVINGTGNLFYYNYFINNNNNGSQVMDNNLGNSWDNGTLGNYYCNYPDADLNHDGIGDQPVNIGTYSVDHFPIVIDQDNDSLNDYSEELLYNTNPFTADTDNDGLNDGTELFVTHTDPLNNDTDNDGMPDGWEAQYNLNPLNSSDASLDLDNDGLTNLQEYQLSTNPLDNDTDNDGMPDGWEVQYNLNPKINDAYDDEDNDELPNVEEYRHNTNPLNNDTDNDGMPDGWEVQYNLNPTADDSSGDVDNDKLINIYEYGNGTNPRSNDTDKDGLTDYDELTKYHTDPLNPDSDGDTIKDGDEVRNGTNPNNPDTDGDGINDNSDFMPKFNNYVLYGIITAVGLSLISLGILVKLKKFPFLKKK